MKRRHGKIIKRDRVQAEHKLSPIPTLRVPSMGGVVAAGGADNFGARLKVNFGTC